MHICQGETSSPILGGESTCGILVSQRMKNEPCELMLGNLPTNNFNVLWQAALFRNQLGADVS